MSRRTPPTNCRCVWKLDLDGDRVTWLRADHVPGCPVHGATQAAPEWFGDPSARFRLDAEDPALGITYADLLSFVVGLLDVGVDNSTTIRAGWRTLRRIEAYK